MSKGMGSKGLAKSFAYLILLCFFISYGMFSTVQLIFAATPIIFAATDATPQPPATFSTVQNKSFSVAITPTNTPVDPNNVIFQIGRNATFNYQNLTRCSAGGQINCTWNNTPSTFYINFTAQIFDRAGISNYTWFARDSAGWWNKSAIMNYTLNPAVPVLTLNNDTALVSTSGLVGYWRFEEGSGTALNDNSGYGNNGTLKGTVAGSTWTAAMFGQGINFDGSTNYVNVSTPSSLKNVFNNGKTFTISAWIYPSGYSASDWRWVFAKAYTSHVSPYYQVDLRYLASSSTNGYVSAIVWRSDAASNYLPVANSPSGSVKLNNWYFVAVVYDLQQNSTNIYINGNLSASASGATIGSYTNFNTPFAIGADINFISSVYNFQGKIDEFQIWNRSLSANEVHELYQSRVAYPTQTNFTGTGCPTSDQDATDVTCHLYRNMALVDNPENQTLNSGLYYYIYNSTNGQNYSSSTILLPLNVTPGSSPGSPSGNIQIYQGWNLISFPYSDSSGLAGTCQPSILNYYSWDPSTKRWSALTGQPPAGKGFWVYSSIQCTMQYTGSSQISSISLSAGWNQIGTFSASRDVATLSGCTINQGPFYYNAQNSNWQYPATSLVLGNGYWIYLNSGCTLT